MKPAVCMVLIALQMFPKNKKSTTLQIEGLTTILQIGNKTVDLDFRLDTNYIAITFLDFESLQISWNNGN